MADETTRHIKALLKDDGHQFAMVRKADLAALLDGAARRLSYDVVNQFGELRRTMAEQSQVIDEAFSTITNNARNARKHGDERRRYMANNRALLAHTEQQAATIAEMGATIDDQAAQLEHLREILWANQAGGLYTCKGKGGEYMRIGYARPSGALRAIQGESGVIAYRDTSTGDLFYRDPADFNQRMEPVK